MIVVTLAIKPLDGTFAENVLRYGLAGMNLEGSRVGTDEFVLHGGGGGAGTGWGKKNEINLPRVGRFPANVILDDRADVLDEFPDTGMSCGGTEGSPKFQNQGAGDSWKSVPTGSPYGFGYGDAGSAYRFFKVIKCSS